MNIRQKLTLSFLLIVSLIFLLASVLIYGFMADYRRDSFYTRLFNKASGTAKLLIEVEEVDLSLLKKIEKDNPTSLPNEKITVYDNENRIAFSTDEDSTLKASIPFLDSVRHSPEIKYAKGDYEIVGFSFQKEQASYVVIAGAIDIFGKKRMQFLRNTLVAVNAISFVIFFISGWFFSGQALAPIQKVMNQVDKITLNRLNLRVDEGNGTDEMARLAKTFNRMLERLELAFKIEKNFIANASHELRTPLTAITGHIEVNLMKDRTVQEYKDSLQSILEDIGNLNSISNRLLLLAQTSTDINGLQFAPARVDEILWEVQAERKRTQPECKVHIVLGDELSDERLLTVSCNEQLLKTALANLADNGCKYSKNNNEVFIDLHSDGSGKIIIRFRDQGIGILPEDINQIFEPFFRGKNALPFKGHGIGLSLVKRIITMHGGSIEVKSMPERGTTFTISLPLT